MAEFCLDCWNKINNKNDKEKKYIISDLPDLCEGCGKFKPVIVTTRRRYYLYKFRYFILPFRIIYEILYFLWRLSILPYLIYKNRDVFIAAIKDDSEKN